MNQPARILILSSGHPCRNPRPVKEAAALGLAGHHVTLLTPNSDPALAQLDKTLLRGAHFRHETVPLKHSLCARARGWLARKSTALGLQSIHALGDPRALLRHARAFRADLTIVHNELPHWIGTRLLADGLRVAADIEDWHSEDLLLNDRVHRPLNLLRNSERTLLHRAAYTTTTSHALADALHNRFGGRRPEVITNSFPLEPAPPASTRNSPPSFFWFSQTIGPGRGLESFLAAWNLMREPSQLVLLGAPVAGFEKQILARLSPDHRTRVRFLPLVPPADLPTLIATHDIGLALEDASIPNRDLTITNKILQYLNAGLAIVASDTAGQREVLSRAPEAGIIAPTHDIPAFTAALDAFVTDRPQLVVRQRTARLLAENVYSWEREAPRLIEIVSRALKTPSA